MCSELFRIPYELGGVPIFGVGVLLAIWTVATAIALAGLVRRHGWRGETWSFVPVMLMLGAAIVLLPTIFPDGLPIRGYGVMLLAGIMAGVGMAMYRARQGGLDHELILSLAIWVVVCGVVGARLFYVIEYWHESFAGKSPRDTLFEILNIPEGGLVIYGGFVGAAVGFAVFVRRHRLPLLAMADLAAPSMMIGLALGRIGCLLNGCCYGGQTDWPWAVSFPQYGSRFEAAKPTAERRFSPPYADQAARGEMHGFRLESRDGRHAVVTRVEPGSPAEASGLRVGDAIKSINGLQVKSTADAKAQLFELFKAQRALRLRRGSGKSVDIAAVAPPARSKRVHPTQLYSAIDAALLGWLLWSFFWFRSRDGEALALMLTIHPITRFLLEYIRIDEPEVFGTRLSISQNISVALLACAVALWWYLSRQPQGVVWPLTAAAARPRVSRQGVRRTGT